MTTTTDTNVCVDCGRPISRGATRCAEDRGKHLKRQHLVATFERDRTVLALVAAGGNSQTVADELGISRSRGADVIIAAQDRDIKRKELGLDPAGAAD